MGNRKKKISATLAEYGCETDANKIYAQFAEESAVGEVLRIELICESGSGAQDSRYGCQELYDKLVPKPNDFTTSHVTDARIWREPDAEWMDGLLLFSQKRASP